MGRTPSESDGQAAHVAGWNAAGATLAAGIGERMGDYQGLRPRAKAPARAGGADDENGITEKVTARAVAFSSG